jgi:hypothetical protein
MPSKNSVQIYTRIVALSRSAALLENIGNGFFMPHSREPPGLVPRGPGGEGQYSLLGFFEDGKGTDRMA